MREILFRGKRVDNGEWIYGVPITDKATGDAYIITSTAGAYLRSEINNMCATGFRAIPETVGQYTGLKDNNGTRIFEGDIINGDSEYFTYSHPYGTIVYDSGEFLIAFDEAFEDVENLGAWANDIEVIGNIHDNPELLKGEQKNETTT